MIKEHEIRMDQILEENLVPQFLISFLSCYISVLFFIIYFHLEWMLFNIININYFFHHVRKFTASNTHNVKIGRIRKRQLQCLRVFLRVSKL